MTKRTAAVVFAVNQAAKRPAPPKPSAFYNEDDDDDDDEAAVLIDDPTYALTVSTAAAARRILDPITQAQTLHREGNVLATAGRFAEALSRWTSALAIDLPVAATTTSTTTATTTIGDSALEETTASAWAKNIRGRLRESCAQAHMQRDEWFLAVKQASAATEILPKWAVAWQTLGRAQLGFGEPALAVTSFETAFELDDGMIDVLEEDLPRANEAVRTLAAEGLTHARLEV
ncbi:Tetratricopeptide repeat protein 33 [Geranomyces variabilis]|uniref:Tetratricopeptide repeat protein 33 n=1 Tax=Geranomyces variabilis TaxID=109894 RepID=A0AAD5XRL2_9FUNG|nr:Tetratricopeptide repeat protein 33 [Geranomyces variabilis]